MTSKDALELLNMFTVATQIAKSKNKVESKFEITETALSNLLKEAFPKLKNANQLAKSMSFQTTTEIFHHPTENQVSYYKSESGK